MSKTQVGEQTHAATRTVTVSAEQAESLQAAFVIAKAVASPTRLAILGACAARLGESLTRDELAQAVRMAPALLDRDLDRLVEAGFLSALDWVPAAPGVEPHPARVAFNRDFLPAMSQANAGLAQIIGQLQPAAAPPAQDDRARTLTRFWKDGRLIAWPAQFKRQVYVLEEVAKAFQAGVHYSERDVDTILKDIYAYDHCTLRRCLVDLKLMQRAGGQYWRAS